MSLIIFNFLAMSTVPTTAETITTEETTPIIETTLSETVTEETTPVLLCQGSEELSHPLIGASGNYMKTACFVFGEFSQADADAYCKAGGMKLFQIDSLELQSVLFAYMEPQLEGYDFMIRVDGLRDTTDNKWYYYSNGKAPAFGGLEWINGPDVLTGFDSMMITNMQYPQSKIIQTFKVDGISAELQIPIACEYQ